jgi:hypothetical protein
MVSIHLPLLGAALSVLREVLEDPGFDSLRPRLQAEVVGAIRTLQQVVEPR